MEKRSLSGGGIRGSKVWFTLPRGPLSFTRFSGRIPKVWVLVLFSVVCKSWLSADLIMVEQSQNRHSTGGCARARGLKLRGASLCVVWFWIEVLLFRHWNQFRNRIFILFQKLMIPTPIPIPAKIDFCSVLESIPGTGIDSKMGYLSWLWFRFWFQKKTES